MPLSYTVDHKGQNNGVGDSVTSNTISALTGDFICVVGCFGDNSDVSTFNVTNTGTAITWTQQVATNASFNSKVVLWYGTAGATPPTSVTVQVATGSNVNTCKSITTMVHSGAHSTSPLPSGNVFSGTGATDVRQNITPSSSAPGAYGSCLWLVCADWIPTNSFSAHTDCTLISTFHQASNMTTAVLRPTTQPRPDGATFQIGENDTAGTIAWVAFEVREQPRSFPPAPKYSTLLDARDDEDDGPFADLVIKAWY